MTRRLDAAPEGRVAGRRVGVVCWERCRALLLLLDELARGWHTWRGEATCTAASVQAHARDEGVVQHTLLPVRESRELRGNGIEILRSAEASPNPSEFRQKAPHLDQLRVDSLQVLGRARGG